jgi:hypothetical protein
MESENTNPAVEQAQPAVEPVQQEVEHTQPEQEHAEPAVATAQEVSSDEQPQAEQAQAEAPAPEIAAAEASAVDAPADPTPTSDPNNPQAWWDAISFVGKDFTELRPDGMLMLKATPFSPTRELQHIHPETASAATHALTEKFKEVETKVREISADWNASTDKPKMGGKVERLRDYLLHATAIGDFTPLYQQVGLWDNILQEGADQAYAERLALVERAEALAAGEEVKKEGLTELRELGEKWKNSHYLDKDRADALWARFETARDAFYNRRREHQESERAELQTNLDLKNELVDKAERLAASDDWKEATNGFNGLMDEWKATGRTFHDKNEVLWQRFITAKNVFYDRKKQHFKEIQSEQDTNYEKKQLLVAQAEALSESTDWNKTSDAYNALMDEWKSIGRVPVEKADELWNRLSAAKDKFFNAKRSHFATMRVTYDDNFAQKSALVNRAENLQRSSDWRAATDEFAELMEEWKKIGPVARRDQNEALWQSFNKARKTFFNRKDEDRDRRKSHMDQARAGRLSQVQEFLSQLKAELKEFEEDVADHHSSMANLGTGKMDNQIRANLERLIGQAGPKLEKKRAKIVEVEAQLAELTKEAQRKPAKEKTQHTTNQTAPTPADTPQTQEETEPSTEAGGSQSAEVSAAPEPEAPHGGEESNTADATEPNAAPPSGEDAPGE